MPSGLPAISSISEKARSENFRVASRLLPSSVRRDLMDVYRYARFVDDIGDTYEGDRLAALDWLEAELRRGLGGGSSLHPIVAGVANLVRLGRVRPDPLFDLVEANRMDQAVSSYESFDELAGYCRLSANPVGRLVLELFGASTPERERWSDSICTGLQLVEHWQDVGEDARAGRIYLPYADLRRFGVDPSELLTEGPASSALRSLTAFEVQRARDLLDDGFPLIASLGGRLKLAVAGFWAGGHAALDALEDRGFDPLSGPARPKAIGVLWHVARAWRSGRSALERPGGAIPTTADDAYAVCERITLEQARNFSYGIRLLPPTKRQAMCALYAMARRIDDIGDGNTDAHEKLRSLEEVRKSLADLRNDPASGRSDPVLVALGDAAERFPLPMTALDELIEGCEMDVNGVRYQSFDELVGYCRRVAGTVGRLSLAVYGVSSEADREKAQSLADALGVALQITNILRDIIEDLETMGRIYLPQEDLERFGVSADLKGPEENIAALIRFEAERARGWYAEGLQLLPMLDWRSRACTAAMAGIYRRLLDRIESDPSSVLRGRVSLTGGQKFRVAARALARGAA